jgi:DNA-binding transcriptional MerR regulator
MPDAGLWTIDELCGLVEAALLASDASQPSARVREVPDRRTIRWYTTIGLLDRPAEMRGRTALYQRRHLLQLVAVKRLQARGVALAEVQAQLAGATDGMLAGLAGIEADPPAAASIQADDGPSTHAAQAEDGPSARAAQAGARQPRFWAAASHAVPGPTAGAARQLLAIRLGYGVTLTLGAADRPLGDEDLSVLQQAAEPLLELLRQRGLDAPNP